ncbi:MAG TPA: hypothetical protein VNU95_00085 [Candidatus Acidoferrales bacterium]|jgi:hypothetical protein|nr:hypothetical protein [Candidatus Acidoferrales bacterium]
MNYSYFFPDISPSSRVRASGWAAVYKDFLLLEVGFVGNQRVMKIFSFIDKGSGVHNDIFLSLFQAYRVGGVAPVSRPHPAEYSD